MDLIIILLLFIYILSSRFENINYIFWLFVKGLIYFSFSLV